MKKQLETGLLLIFLLFGWLALISDIQPVKAAATIYIRADGTIDPPSAPIHRNGDLYTIMEDIEDTIIVQKNNTILNGADHQLFGSGQAVGVGMYYVYNVTIVNLRISGFNAGIEIASSSYITVVECDIFSNLYHGVMLNQASDCDIILNTIEFNQWDGIRVQPSSAYNEIAANNIMNNSFGGIHLNYTEHNTVHDNNITGNGFGIRAYESHNSSIMGNFITGNTAGGIHWEYTQYSVLRSNTIAENGWGGISCINSSDNQFFHNNIIDNANQVSIESSASDWDFGYPAGGNYWSNLEGEDLFHGPYQNETGHDGISDTPYYYDASPLDNYPLMGPFGPSTGPGINVTVFPLYEISMIFQNITEQGETFATALDIGPPPPPAYEMMARYKISTTAAYFGDIFLRFIYDDSGMTPQQEEEMALFLIAHIEGDVDYDFDVDIYDIVTIVDAYGTRVGHPDFNPLCDFDEDGDVDIYDVVKAANNYGMTVPEEERYLDVTTNVDPEFNLIFGIAPHLSIWGVTRRN